MSKSLDLPLGFSCEILSRDGCAKTCLYRVDATVRGSVVLIDAGVWSPRLAQADIDQVRLTTHYTSGRDRTIEMDGSEHADMERSGRMPRLLAQIAKGRTPGEALQRQLTKAMHLARSPKAHWPKLKACKIG